MTFFESGMDGLWNWLSNNTGPLSTLAAVGALLVSVATLFVAVIQIGRASRQLRADSEERTRPYIFLDVVPGLQGTRVWDLIISNTGKTTARDVRISLNQDLPTDEADKVGPNLAKLFEAGLTLPPGSRRRVMWRFEKSPQDVPPEAMGAPADTEAEVIYTGEINGTQKVYRDSYPINLKILGPLVPSPSSGPKATRWDKESEGWTNLDHVLRAIAKHVAEIRR